MDAKNKNATSIDLHSLVNSHEKPFVIIDRDYSILAVNTAYEQRYGAEGRDVIGRKCYEISHGKDRPCSEEGEECPHNHVFKSGTPTVCAHIHCDAEHHMHQVKVSAFPLKDIDGELYLGECIEEVAMMHSQMPGSDRMVGETPAFLACVEQLKIAASSDAPVLLQGETGTGKELAAEYIHQHSARCFKPFQIVDSTVLTETLFEAEMFGHANGAYTGSVGEKQGLFELAEGGTIFLDEIGDLLVSQQAKLLRVLESGQYRRVGGKHTRKADVRIICATNSHLWESVLAGKFREDLYYRIACLNIRLPALRERLEDVPVLAATLLDGINRAMRSSYHLTEDALIRLKQYQYPGNVRELRNILFIAATQCHSRVIDAALIDAALNNLPQCNGDVAPEAASAVDYIAGNGGVGKVQQIPETLEAVEKKHIIELLARYGGNRQQVADALGISVRTMYRKLKSLGINKDE